MFEFAHRLRGSGLTVVSCGVSARDRQTVLSSKTFTARILELRKNFDFVLIDLPPLREYGQPLVSGQTVDGYIIIVEANSTRREMVLKAKEDIENANVRVLGAVLNNRKFPIPEFLYSRL
jgi:Mrp family chromosome partitioning ATPase